MTKKLITYEDIQLAHRRIKPYIHKTPVLTSKSINNIIGCEVYFKCENFQKVGAFKMRGATNAILLLSTFDKQHGVATHSSGNHGQAVALSARQNSMKAYIVMPENAPEIKKKAVEGYGAKVIECKPTLQSREQTLQETIKETGAAFIHPYNDVNVIAGQGTVALEFLDEIPYLDLILVPVGGGGLISGTALATHYLSRKTKVIGCEPKGADDVYNSFGAGIIVKKDHPKSIADGLLSTVGQINFDIIKTYVHQILTVEESEIIMAMKLVWERMKIIIEPSAAVPLAALINNKENYKGEKVGIILSGGNVDVEKFHFNI
ncbi:MAG: threonine/serine dehydratase [Bacteroidota bacterium]|nr:threonine/serine dehydratase [Bacteroidota bacterium]